MNRSGQFRPPGPWAGLTAIVLALVGVGLFVLALSLGVVFALLAALVAAGWLSWRRIRALFGRPAPARNAGPVVIEGRYRVVKRNDDS